MLYLISEEQQVGEHLPAGVHEPGPHSGVLEHQREGQAQAVQLAQELRVRAAAQHFGAEGSEKHCHRKISSVYKLPKSDTSSNYKTCPSLPIWYADFQLLYSSLI